MPLEMRKNERLFISIISHECTIFVYVSHVNIVDMEFVAFNRIFGKTVEFMALHICLVVAVVVSVVVYVYAWSNQESHITCVYRILLNIKIKYVNLVGGVKVNEKNSPDENRTANAEHQFKRVTHVDYKNDFITHSPQHN